MSRIPNGSLSNGVLDIVSVVARTESVVLFLAGKQRIHTGNLKFHLDAV